MTGGGSTSPAGRSARTSSRPSAGPGWSRRPTPSPATTSCSRCGSTSTSRGWSTATSARPTSRRPSTWSSSARRRACAMTRSALRDRLAAEVADPSPTGVARRAAGRPRDPGRRPCRRDPAVPGLRHAVLRVYAAALPGRAVRCGRGSDRRAASRGRSAGGAARSVGCPLRRARSIGCRAWSSGSSPASETRRPPTSASPTARTCASRWSPASPGRPTTGSTAAAAHASTSTPTSRSVPPDLIGTIAHETYPGHHLEHAWKEADLVDTQGRLESSILLINTPECLISEGLADLGVRFASPPRAGGPARRDLRAGGAGLRRGSCRRHARPRSRRVALAVERERLGAISGNAAILRHADGRSHDEVVGVPARRRSLPGDPGGEAARVHRGPAVADLCVRLRRGRGSPPSLAGGSGGTRACRPIRAAPPRAADAGRGHSSRLKTTRSPPSAS